MKRENIVGGLILILAGGAFLVYQLFPDLFAGFAWPWILLVLGGVFALASLIARIGGLMIPGAVLLGLGGIFLYQTNSGDWDSWAYIWALIPGFVGVGMLLGGLYDPELAGARRGAFIMIVISLILFAVFGGFFGLSAGILRFWPVLLIVAGLWVLWRSRRPEKEKIL